MIDIRVTRQNEVVQLEVSGELSFATAIELHATIVDAMPERGRLRLVLAGISSFDLSGLQLLLALCRSGKADGVIVDVVTGPSVGRLEKMLRFAGLSPIPCVRR